MIDLYKIEIPYVLNKQELLRLPGHLSSQPVVKRMHVKLSDPLWTAGQSALVMPTEIWIRVCPQKVLGHANVFGTADLQKAVRTTAPQVLAALGIDASAPEIRKILRTGSYRVREVPCTAEELIAYIRLLVRRVAPATIVRRVMAVQDCHSQRGLALPTDDPRIREALRLMASGLPPLNLGADIKGASVAAPKRDSRKRSAAPITRALLTRMIDAMGTGARSLDRRDKAIFLLGFSGMKRGTICALNVEDLTFTPDAMLVRLKAAGDGEAGRTIAIPVTRGPLCAATAVQQWIAHNAMEGCSGPLFPRFTRSGEPVLTERLDSAYVSKLVKARLRDAGVEDVAAYSGESLRLGHSREFDGCRRS